MGRYAQRLMVLVLLLPLCGCAKFSLRPTELTFAGTDVMLRGIEQINTNVEYYDETTKAVKVKKARIDPPFWIVSEKYLEEKIGGSEPSASVAVSKP